MDSIHLILHPESVKIDFDLGKGRNFHGDHMFLNHVPSFPCLV